MMNKNVPCVKFNVNYQYKYSIDSSWSWRPSSTFIIVKSLFLIFYVHKRIIYIYKFLKKTIVLF